MPKLISIQSVCELLLGMSVVRHRCTDQSVQKQIRTLCSSLKFNLAYKIHMGTQGALQWCPPGCQIALKTTFT